METVDEEFLGAALDFIDRQHRANKPWFCYFNPTRMHVWTHLKPASQGKTGLGLYPDGMVELDGYVGQLLKKLDDLGVADNTIVVFTTDNGAEVMSWPDGGTTPFRGEKATNWEGGYRVPMVIRWPGTIKPGTVYNEMFSHYDLIPTFAAAGGDPDIVAKVPARRADRQQDLQGPSRRLQPHAVLQGRSEGVAAQGVRLLERRRPTGRHPCQRLEGRLPGAEQQGHRGMAGQFTDLRLPKLFNLRADPFERGDESILYNKWMADRAFVQVPMQALAAKWLESFKEFPLRQKPASFNLDEVMRKIEAAGKGAN